MSFLTTRPCWIAATVDGRVALRQLFQAGARETLDVERELVLIAGDAGALELTLNGIQARPLGRPGEVVTARFNARQRWNLHALHGERLPHHFLISSSAARSLATCGCSPRKERWLPALTSSLPFSFWLLEDTDPEIRRTADSTLNQIPVTALKKFLARSDVSINLREFFADRGVFPDEIPAIEAVEDQDQPLVEAETEPAALETDEAKLTAVQRLAAMSFTERLKAAMKGTRGDPGRFSSAIRTR
mgnify:CR=1 FL=1